MILLILLLIAFLCLLYIIFSSKLDGANKKFKEIPGPKELPLVGNIQDILCAPDEIWRRMRTRALTYFPIYRVKLFNRKIVNLFDPVDLEVIMGNSKYNRKGEFYELSKVWLGNGILVSEGPTWRKSRKLLTKSFHYGVLPNYIQSFHNAVDTLNSLLEQETGKPINLSTFLNMHSLRIACENLYGQKLDNKDHILIEAIETMCMLAYYKISIPLLNLLYKYTWLKAKEDEALKIFSDFATRAIKDHLHSESTENELDSRLLNVLLKNFDEQGIRDEINTFIFAGQDTTSTALYFILYVLAYYPHYQNEIYKEMMQTAGNENPTYGEINQMNLLDRFVKECLRMYPPVYFNGRVLNEDVVTPSGYTIPAGCWIFFQIFDVHRNPQIYSNPDNFDPDRFLPENVRQRHPYSFIPFSAGPRNCIAQKFAMMEIKTTVCGILKKFKMEAVGSLEDIILVPGLLLKTKNPLKVKLTPRQSQ